MAHHKVIFTGPVGAGKTTAIHALSDIAVVKTDVAASDSAKSVKAMTTVVLDYGLVSMANVGKVHLYGTPGQDRFDFMWEILVKGGMGLVLLLSNSRPKPIEDMWFYLDAFKLFIDKTQVTIGITQSDVKHTPDVADYRAALASSQLSLPVFKVDARRKQDVSILVQSLLPNC